MDCVPQPWLRARARVESLVDVATPAGQVDNVTDVDSGALLGIAITATDSGNGSWFYSLDNGTIWNGLGALTGASARLLAVKLAGAPGGTPPRSFGVFLRVVLRREKARHCQRQ